MLVTQTRAGQDHCSQGWVRQMDGQATGNEDGFTGMKRDRPFDAGPKIHPCRARRGIPRGVIPKARVQDLYVDVVHGVTGEVSAFMRRAR